MRGYKKETAEKIIEKFPNTNNLQLARMLTKEYPELYYDIEDARKIIRVIRGASGKDITRQSMPRRSEETIESCRHLSKLPEPESSKFKVYKLPDDIKRYLCIADLHMPYHDKTAIETAFQWGQTNNCDGLLINGDLGDFYQLSVFEREPDKMQMTNEIEYIRKFFDYVKEIGFKSIIWKLGNHCARLEHYIIRKAPELYGLEEISLQFLFRDYPIMFVEDYNKIQHGKLHILHGHEKKKTLTNPVNPARGMYLWGNECILSAHLHRTSEHTEQSIDGRVITCWSIGCLSDLHPRFDPFNKWNLGAAILTTGRDWEIINKRIVNGKIK